MQTISGFYANHIRILLYFFTLLVENSVWIYSVFLWRLMLYAQFELILLFFPNVQFITYLFRNKVVKNRLSLYLSSPILKAVCVSDI